MSGEQLTSHDGRVMLSGLKGALPFPRLRSDAAVFCFLQREGGQLLQGKNIQSK